LKTLLDLIDDSSSEGYNVLSVSGGEPMLYPGLGAVLDHAHSRGMVALVVSNGMLLDERRLARLTGLVDLLAISIDGIPESHNRIRGSDHAWDLMTSRLKGIREAGIPFGFVFTLTLRNAHELEWVARFAAEQGAAQLQVHALEEVGRAEECMRGLRPDQIETGVAWIEAHRIQSLYRDQLRVSVDFVDTLQLRSHPDLVLAGSLRSTWETDPLADLLSPLVLEADGTLVPLQYGFPRRYAIGQVGTARLPELAANWRASRYGHFLELCRRAFETLTSGEERIVDWYRVVALAGARETDTGRQEPLDS
jgi:MoaA/NifB/PqqE/SkfB family radical SAM enzyme